MHSAVCIENSFLLISVEHVRYLDKKVQNLLKTTQITKRYRNLLKSCTLQHSVLRKKLKIIYKNTIILLQSKFLMMIRWKNDTRTWYLWFLILEIEKIDYRRILIIKRGKQISCSLMNKKDIRIN